MTFIHDLSQKLTSETQELSVEMEKFKYRQWAGRGAIGSETGTIRTAIERGV